jgi:radical SAM protein with 4Fe4S-binding SPASM domain
VERALQATGRRIVQLSGGEPLLRPDLFEIVEKLRAPGRTISLVTDAGLLDDGVAQRLKELGVGPVQPTLLAARREVHDHIKGAPSFDATVAAIIRLRKAGVPVSVSFVCTRVNHAHFRDVVELCFALGVQTVAQSRFCNAGAGADAAEELTPTPDMVADNLDVAAWAETALGMKVNVAISLPLCLPREEQRKALKLGRCALGSRFPGYTIDPWGRLRACSVSPVILGDLRSETWEAIESRARDGYFREVAALPSECSGCSLADACGGGCRESARSAYGTLDRADPMARAVNS